MDASTLTADSPLPDDVPTLHGIIRQLLGKIDELQRKLDAALLHRFGRRSERRTPPPGPTKRKPGKAAPHGRGALPDHLERRDVVFDLADEEKPCPCCGQSRVCIGEQIAEQLEMEPVRFYVLRTRKKVYACQHCEPPADPTQDDPRFTTAGPAQVGPISRGLCGPALLAHAVTAKFADHCPVNRLAEQLGRSGVKVARSTLGGWLRGAAELLGPLVGLMRQRVLLSRVIHGDDTGVKLRVVGQEKTKRSHLWAYIGDADNPYCVFDFTADYTATGPEAFLEGYRGYLQADALAQYEGLYRLGVKHCCCWAHARRKFVAAQQGKDERAARVVEWIGQLYAVERELPPLLGPAEDPVARQQREEERRRLRQEKAKPILDEMKKWLEEMKPNTLPKSLLGQAIGYALNNWEALGRYLEQGYLGIDNNTSERTLRPVAIGRNNWVALGGETGGETAAVLYTVVQSCKHLGIDPFAYLREALAGLFALGEAPTAEQLSGWLPDRWKQRQDDRAKARPPG